jgi:hypothetical protein
MIMHGAKAKRKPPPRRPSGRCLLGAVIFMTYIRTYVIESAPMHLLLLYRYQAGAPKKRFILGHHKSGF